MAKRQRRKASSTSDQNLAGARLWRCASKSRQATLLTQRAQYCLIKEYSLNHIGILSMI